MAKTLDGKTPGNASSEPTAKLLLDRFVEGTLPLFLNKGWDGKRGGLFERLTKTRQPDGTPFRRSMVHGRQLYVYSVWAERLGSREYAEYADRIFQHLVGYFRDVEQGGWIEKTDLSNSPTSQDKILYSHAFIIFGLTAYRYFVNREESEVHLDHTVEYVYSKFRNNKGFYTNILDRSGRNIGSGVDQNPLMHLLEAMLFVFERSGRSEALDIAREIVDLVAAKFIKDGLVLEHLTNDLEPHPDTGHLIEPGHQVEWGWLLKWYGTLCGSGELDDVSKTLIDRGIALGWDSLHGGLFDQIHRETGEIVKATKRLWPLGELIKAGSASPDSLNNRGMVLGDLIAFFCGHYLKRDGTWRERLNRDLSVADPTMPASSCYHTSLALTEALKAARL